MAKEYSADQRAIAAEAFDVVLGVDENFKEREPAQQVAVMECLIAMLASNMAALKGEDYAIGQYQDVLALLCGDKEEKAEKAARDELDLDAGRVLN